MVGMVARFKFYFAWAISEASLIMSGFCFNGFTDQARLLPSDEQCLSRIHDQTTYLPRIHVGQAGLSELQDYARGCVQAA